MAKSKTIKKKVSKKRNTTKKKYTDYTKEIPFY